MAIAAMTAANAMEHASLVDIFSSVISQITVTGASIVATHLAKATHRNLGVGCLEANAGMKLDSERAFG